MHSRYLTIVPLFHCNGWCHTWMMPAVGGTVVCCRDITAEAIYNAVAYEGVTHFGGAPIVLNMLVNAPQSERRALPHRVEVFTAGAPPAPATLAKIEALGFNVTQVYGLTETYGHVTECLWRDDWDAHPAEAKAAIKARQGVPFPMMEDPRSFTFPFHLPESPLSLDPHNTRLAVTLTPILDLFPCRSGKGQGTENRTACIT